jgi:hypothetical protein
MDEAQSSIEQAEEDATEYDQLAAEFEELAERHQGFADMGESSGAALLDEIDSDDSVTDRVEDAFARSDQDLDFGFNLIDGRSGNDLDIEVDRDATPESTDSTAFDSEDSTAPAVDDGPLPDVTSEASLSDLETIPVLEESLDSDELDVVSESDVITDSPEPVEFAVLEEQSLESEFEDQIDVADALEESFDDVLDDQA